MLAEGKAKHHHDDAKKHGDNTRNDDENLGRFEWINHEQNAKQKAQDGTNDIETSVYQVFDAENDDKHEKTDNGRP